MNYNSKDLKEMSNAVRALALRAIRTAGSGHVGIVPVGGEGATTYGSFWIE